MENIQIVQYSEYHSEVYKFSYVHIRHRYMTHDMIKLQAQLYISVRNGVYDHKVMHDVMLKIKIQIIYVKAGHPLPPDLRSIFSVY